MACENAIGKLDQLIKIERVTYTTDAIGGRSESWAADPAEGVWASIRLITGYERVAAGRTSAMTMYAVKIRWRADANGAPYYSTADRVIWRAREWGITAVTIPAFDNRYLELQVIEGAVT